MNLNERAHELICLRRFEDAISILQESLSCDDTQWNAWELLGQCFRFTNNYDDAIQCLTISTNLNPDNKSAFLSLGIAYQMAEKYQESLSALRHANELDRDYVLAYNSAAMTLKLMGNLEKSILVYEQALLSLSREFCFNAMNERGGEIIPRIDTHESDLWTQPLAKAAIQHSTLDGLDGVTFPTSTSAEIETRDRTHEGLLWEDIIESDGKKFRVFFPNFFNTALFFFIDDGRYSTIVGNLSNVLKMVGRESDSEKYYLEAVRFSEMRMT